VYRLDRDWTNPVRLFGAGGIGSLTYDETANSLWVSQFSNMTITQYTLADVVLSSFSTGHNQNMALALDHADTPTTPTLFREVRLYESRLLPTGGVYSLLGRAELGTGG
jgi:hypothetical protein